MKSRRHQQGMTMWGMMFVIAVIAAVVFLFFKLFPPYKDNFKVRASLDSVVREAGGDITREQLLEGLSRRFDIDDISHINLREDLQIATRGRNKIITINYEHEVPIVANIYVVLKFENEKQVAAGGDS